MYLWIALLLQNKLLIWRPLGYCELSVPSYNMLFSLLTAADFLYHQFWEFDSWSRQSLPTYHNIFMLIFNILLLGNLLKEVKEITCWSLWNWKRWVQIFKISQLYLFRSTLNFPRPVLFGAYQTYFKTLRQKFWRLYFNHFIVAVVVAM